MATPQTTTYSLDGVTISLGPILLDGFAEGEAISIEFPDGFTEVVGADGKVARAKSLNKTATITVNLMQTSATNDLLSALYLLDLNAPNGAGIVPLYIRDRGGRTLITAPQAWVKKGADVTLGNEVSSRTWTIFASQAITFVGGN